MEKKLQIISKESSFNTILFVALVPDEVDRNGDIITEFEITKTAYEFMQNLSDKVVDVNHNNEDVVDTAKFFKSFKFKSYSSFMNFIISFSCSSVSFISDIKKIVIS